MALSTFVPNPSGPGGTIQIFLNGQLVGIWDARDIKGTIVPNGYYHFVLEEKDASGGKILMERDAYINAHHGEPIALSAAPNIAYAGGSIVFNGSLSGIPADGQSRIKVYTVGGELVKTLTPSGGSVTWDLSNGSQSPVASGVYLVVLEGKVGAGDKLHKIIKVLVIR